MPGYGLSLAVFIAGEPYHVGLPGFAAQLADQVLLLGRHFVFYLEVSRQVLAEVALGQVAHVADARHHLVVLAQKLLQGLHLARRLYYH
mgnify:CR=1 FL=1